MSAIQPVADNVPGGSPFRPTAPTQPSAASQTAAAATSTAVVSSSLNVTMIHTHVDAMLAAIGGEAQNNQLLRMMIALLILQALLGNDGGNQQAGASALLDLLGQTGANRHSEMVSLHSATNVVQIEQQSEVVMTSQAPLAPTATEGDPDNSGREIDLSA